MKKGVLFEVSTTDFDHAIEVCEVAFGFEGYEWERLKRSRNIEYLSNFLNGDDIDAEVFYLED